ncbi:hypothetical protein QZJ86_05720 [Methylomonas montana]|uniref:hypothetical protein n=1 Tax=Methylomonas montana TaxID=3058963 RepID=UPI00265B15C0|nr:hypothetical protein [Methylomonas montana]WKJ91632.1 hypothetical protein QZJ86_05720 [Methylomonas montana]
MHSQTLILKNALSFIQKREGLPYDSALLKITKIIATGAHGDNPLFGHLVASGLPADPSQLHQLLAPAVAIHG